MKTHHLKTHPEYYQQIVKGKKPFEVRRNDRGFEVGDLLVLEEYCPERKDYTGKEVKRYVHYILNGGQFGIEEGFVVMSINIVAPILLKNES